MKKCKTPGLGEGAITVGAAGADVDTQGAGKVSRPFVNRMGEG